MSNLSKFQFTTKTWLIVGLIAVVVIAGIIWIGTQAPATPKNKIAGQVTVTINKAIGIEYIIIDNLSTDETNIKTFIALPYTFNCSKSAIIQFETITQPNYLWNSYEFTDGTFDHHNPMIVSADTDLVITPTTIRLNVTPSPSPSPSPTPTPTNEA